MANKFTIDDVHKRIDEMLYPPVEGVSPVIERLKEIAKRRRVPRRGVK